MTTTSFSVLLCAAGQKPRRRRALFALMLAMGLSAGMAACGGDDNTTPDNPIGPSPTVTGVTVTGAATLNVAGATAQFTASVTLSDGTSEDRTRTAAWQSSNAAVATVSSEGLVKAVAGGTASITAAVGEMKGSRTVTVSLPNRAPDPAAGQRLPMPDVQAFVRAAVDARPDLLAQSCPDGLKYVTNPWLDYMVGRLRTLDTRWGYNGKPTRTAADNNGVPVVAAGDEVAYHFGAGPDEGSPDVYLIDILEGHCGSSPRVTYRVFTGEEPGRWTSAGKF
jgi:hypothetical protein